MAPAVSQRTTDNRRLDLARTGDAGQPAVREGTRLDGGSPGLVIRVVLTALVFTGGRGTGSAIAAVFSGSSSSGAAW